MAYTLRAVNQYGDEIDLTGRRDMVLTRPDGFHPADAIINMDALALNDGALFNSSRVGTRNIVLTVHFTEHPEQCRHEIYKVFKPKQAIMVYYKNNTRDVYIDGYVESVTVDLAAQLQNAQISILCPRPFFRDIRDGLTDFTVVTPLLEFPVEFPEEGIPFSEVASYAEKAVLNGGEVETGVLIEFSVRGNVTRPQFYNTTTGEAFILDYSFIAGDSVQICTLPGEKRATLKRDGVTINLLNSIGIGSSWLRMTVGDNVFAYTADQGAEYIMARFIVTPLYEGV